MRFLAPLVAALAVSAVAQASTTTLRSGLYGTVMRGPITPVCVAEEPCSEPAAGAVLVFSRNGTDVARVTVASDGSYRVRMRAGLYAVRTGKRLTPTTARVYVGRMARLDFSIDTGIR